MIREKDLVRILGFMVGNGSDDMNERSNINRYAGKVGEIVSIDQDKLHPVTVKFSCKVMPRSCRFSEKEFVRVI